jgi:hypothetical protein
MNKKLVLLCLAAFTLAAMAVSAADLTIDMQVNTTAKDYTNNYLTFKGLVNSVEKDQFAPGADATSGASKLLSTEVFNAYRFDVKGKATLPGSLRSLLLYAVADDGTRTGDNLTVTKAASGVITIRYIHRGTAYDIVTDATGKLALPATTIRKRVIGDTANNLHTDFSSTGKTANVDWAKVWDTSIASGKTVGTTTVKTGDVATDVATSAMFLWTGAYQFTFDGKILKIAASLDAVKQ